MTTPPDSAKPAARHIELEEPEETQHAHGGEASKGLRNDKGWDGKLRVDRAALANPEALSDPEYSDEENVMQGDAISADEGAYTCVSLATALWCSSL